MKRLLIAWLVGVAGAASICSGQSVMLKVTPLENTRRTTSDNRGWSSDYNRTQVRSQLIKITVTNMHTNTFDYVVEWFFLGRPASGGGTNSVYDTGKKTVPLARGKFDSFEIQSKEIESESSNYGDGYRHPRGLRTDGYVVVVWAGEKIVGVDASDINNRRKYTTPKLVKKLRPPEEPSHERRDQNRAPADEKKDEKR